MKRIILLALVILAVFCCAAAASEGGDGTWVDLPDAITVDLNGFVRVNYVCPSGSFALQVSCSDPDAFQSLGVTSTEQLSTRRLRMNKLGQYTLHFTTESGFSKDVQVTVEPAATAIYFEKNPLILAVGQTVPVRYTVEGGTLYDPFLSYQTALSFDLSGDVPTVTGNETGVYPVMLSHNLGYLTVCVLDPCEGVQLRPEYDRGSVGMQIPIKMVDSRGEPVYERVTLTEGKDCAELDYYGSDINLRCNKAGWVTIKATGIDGSTDEKRLRIYEPPTSIQVSLSAQTVPVGQSITVNAVYQPEGTWYPLGIDLNYSQPDSGDLTGPVASKEGNVITGLLPGTCELHVYAAGISCRYPLTFTSSDQALVFERPEPYFDYLKPFQLSVHDRSGKAIPAEYSAAGPYIHVTKDGLLTADQKNAYGTVTVQLKNGLTYSFPVESREFPKWLIPEADILTMPLDILSCEMCKITSDVTISNTNDLVLCSNDESVVKVDNWRILPQSVGSATLTVWSRYSGARCTVLAVVTEPCGRLFLNGRPDDASIFIAYDTVTDLPTVTGYWGNPVNVTWSIVYESITSSNPGKHVVSIVKDKQLKCLYFEGAAYLQAVSASGAVMNVTVFPYLRDTTCSFRESEYTVTTGDFAQVDFIYGASGSANPRTLQPQDVTFTLTGDTDCVLVEEHFEYHTFTGLREGTVTLKAKLYNGRTASAVIHVVTPQSCKNGHDPQWFVQDEPTATLDGLRVLRCSRCRVPLGQEEAIPCTGVLSFAQPDIYLMDGGDSQIDLLEARLNGDRKQSFTYHSSNPDVVAVVGDLVYGIQPGTATITVTKGDCVPAVCKVHVSAYGRLSIPSGLKEIPDSAFQGVSAASAVIPGGVTSIGASAFADCSQLEEVVIPASVTEIAENAFANDPLLTVTVTRGSYAEQYCIDNSLNYRYAGE